MLKAKIAAAVLPLMFISTVAGAEGQTTCKYSDKTVVKNAGIIEGTRNEIRETREYSEDKRVCAVSFEAKIDGKWYKTSDFYVFGPDISENSACKSAVKKAAIKALEKNSPVMIDSEIVEVCDETIVEGEPKVKVEEKIVYIDSHSGQVLKDKPCPTCVRNDYMDPNWKPEPERSRTISVFDIFNLGSLFLAN